MDQCRRDCQNMNLCLRNYPVNVDQSENAWNVLKRACQLSLDSIIDISTCEFCVLDEDIQRLNSIIALILSEIKDGSAYKLFNGENKYLLSQEVNDLFDDFNELLLQRTKKKFHWKKLLH